MNIGVVGQGYVGTAVKTIFEPFKSFSDNSIPSWLGKVNAGALSPIFNNINNSLIMVYEN